MRNFLQQSGYAIDLRMITSKIVFLQIFTITNLQLPQVWSCAIEERLTGIYATFAGHVSAYLKGGHYQPASDTLVDCCPTAYAGWVLIDNTKMGLFLYCKTCLKRLLENEQNNGLKDKL